jgi:hypothetical protein
MLKNLVVVKQVRAPLSTFLDSSVMWVFIILILVILSVQESVQYMDDPLALLQPCFYAVLLVLVQCIDRKELL